jgi:rhodanese-related sulfurtransferase
MNLLKQLFGSPIPTLGPAEAQARFKDKPQPFVLDVREPDEYHSGHIAGAKLIPLGQLNQRMKELPQDREILCVCQSGSRSGNAARQLASAGYRVINLKGGLIAWEWARLPMKMGPHS